MEEFCIHLECEYDFGGSLQSGRSEIYLVTAKSYDEAAAKCVESIKGHLGDDFDEDLCWTTSFSPTKL